MLAGDPEGPVFRELSLAIARYGGQPSQMRGMKTREAAKRGAIGSIAGEGHMIAASAVREHGLATLCRAVFNSNEFLFVD